MGEGASKPVFHGHSGTKHSGVPESHVSNQQRTAPPLASEDESPDSEEPVSFGYKTNMLGGSSNLFSLAEERVQI